MSDTLAIDSPVWRSLKVKPVGTVEAGPSFGNITLAGLAALKDPAHPANEMIDSECSQKCGVRFKVSRFWAPLTACQACVDKRIEADRMANCRTYWESLCPEAYRDTDTGHPDFPKEQYKDVTGYAGEKSLFLGGPSGTGKTRLGVLLLKRCLAKHSMFVGALWPEDLKEMAAARSRLEQVKKWGRYDLLLMDDPFLTGAADGKMADVIKDVLDYRFRHKRPVIVTSQVDKNSYEEEAAKYGKITKAAAALLDAIFGRLKEECQLVTFFPKGSVAAAPKVDQGEYPF